MTMTHAEMIERLEWRISSLETSARRYNQTLVHLAEDYPLKTPEAIQRWNDATENRRYCQAEAAREKDLLARIRAKKEKTK